ncbi:hypothetical protein KIH86_14210 [Paenibacillus sp. HN-1]|uniref:hypothetical protein n=1 Tax=Paenibacillus TaxID=44249 RepID=UPI001CA8FC16|nr:MULTISPECIES: hypothetical protein [Paenibacillus]MBY9080674.1 hypothetical protein [Paenibacillus sp. CGMCC 1.18879]MBY9085381.1 hypothetical protein [Paenibacillus sinensis]
MIIGTVVNASGLPQARLMAASVKRIMPETTVVVCLVEQFLVEPLPDIDWIFTAKEISAYIGFPDFDGHMFKFNSLQCATAMKAQLTAYLLRAFPAEEQIVYLDPEMYVFKPFSEIWAMLTYYDVVLTPHHLEPSPAWDCSREIGTLVDGTYNSALVGVRNSDGGRYFADWWVKMTSGDFHTQPKGLYIDQPYLNFVPSCFHTGILRHTGYNLGFWNLHEHCRELYWVEDQYYLTDWTSLRCANFNNFAGMLDSSMNVFIPDNWVYAQMWKNYKQELEALLSWQSPFSWSYDYFASGEKISDETRLRYREAKIYHAIEANPFTLSNESQF